MCRTILLQLFFFCMLPFPVAAELSEVVVEGATEVCFQRESALTLARVTASNNAYEACRALGDQWRFGAIKFAGYEQCFQCGKSKEFKCKVTQAAFTCRRPDPKVPKAAQATESNPITSALERLAGSPESTASTGRTASTGNPLEDYEQRRQTMRDQLVLIQWPVNNQSVSTRIIELVGNTQGDAIGKPLSVRFNGSVQTVPVAASGAFRAKVALKAGANAIEVCLDERCTTVNVSADIPALALMATLTWGGRGDLDLHVATPSGKRCAYDAKVRAGECRLDVDDTKGNNPENMSVPADAPKGRYRFWVINYNGVAGVSGTLKIYKNEILVDSRTFSADGVRGSTLLAMDADN